MYKNDLSICQSIFSLLVIFIKKGNSTLELFSADSKKLYIGDNDLKLA